MSNQSNHEGKNHFARRKWLQQVLLTAGGLGLGKLAMSNARMAPSHYGDFSSDQSHFSGVGNRFASKEQLLEEAWWKEREIFVTENNYGFSNPPEMKARLLANENPFGPASSAKKAAIEALDKSYQYPFGEVRKLQEKILKNTELSEKNIIISSGSTPLLHAAAAWCGLAKGKLVTADLTYDDLPETAEFMGAVLVKVPLNEKLEYDLPAMKKAAEGAKLVYICNPNNPTGTSLDPKMLMQFCEEVGKNTTILIDEAYIDYLPNPATQSMLPAIKKGLNVLVARTFSKIYGMAGMRIGYLLGPEKLVEEWSPYTIGPMNIAATSAAAAAASFDDQGFLQLSLQKTLESRDFLYKVLTSENYTYTKSAANFVFFPIKMETKRFAQEMMKRGVGIRTWTYRNQPYCRISMGTPEEMQVFEKAFKEIS